jgi:ATP-dependent DNA helicase RecG
VGLFRVAVPRVDRNAFREAIANARTHRDYARLGTVHVRFDGDALSISNPGGFVEGVTTENLLTTDPHPRNPVLADAFKRVGLVERTGRGVDLIYRGLLRYGRAKPDYSRSSATSVVLRLSASAADFDFLRLMLDAEQRNGGPLPIDSLIALTCLRDQRRLTVEELATLIQKDRAAAKQTLEGLMG